MIDIERMCFIIMPFQPELNYFYLYLKQHIEKRANFRCERADAQYLAKPIPDKIYEFIQKAHVIIADCSGSNANVFYEIGMAYALNKKVILITKDAHEKVPFDVKHYEIIHHEFDKPEDFLKQLDGALDNIFSEKYEKLFEPAKALFEEFRKAAPGIGPHVSKEKFISNVRDAERTEELPSLENYSDVARFVLPKIVPNLTNPDVMELILSWLNTHIEGKQKPSKSVKKSNMHKQAKSKNPRR